MRRPTALVLALALALPACGGFEMEDQKKYEPYERADYFPDGSAAQHPVPGTVFRGELALEAVLDERPSMTLDLLERGQERYGIYCWPCHGAQGYGDGIITEHGFPNPPSFHLERLREAPAEHFVRVIEDGYGIMYSYAARVAPEDRWAIVAYIRALQLSQRARSADLPEADRSALERQGG